MLAGISHIYGSATAFFFLVYMPKFSYILLAILLFHFFLPSDNYTAITIYLHSYFSKLPGMITDIFSTKKGSHVI